MKKRHRISRRSRKKLFDLPTVSFIVVAILTAFYFAATGIQDTKFLGFMAPPSECADATAEVYLLNSQFVGNAIIINVSSPTCIIAVANFHFGIPSEITVDLEGITGTGAFADLNLRQKKKGIDLEMQYVDMSDNPLNYGGTVTIPFSASNPGDYDISAKERMRFLTDDGKRINVVFHIPRLVLQMFNFSFYVQPSITAGAVNKVPAGSFGDAILNTTVAGSFIFNMTVSDAIASLNKQLGIQTLNPIYIWKESFDAYLHPENRHACNAGTVDTGVMLDFNGNKVSNGIKVELTKPKLSDIYPILDRYFNSIGTDTEDAALIPRAYYMVGSYFNCP